MHHNRLKPRPDGSVIPVPDSDLTFSETANPNVAAGEAIDSRDALQPDGRTAGSPLAAGPAGPSHPQTVWPTGDDYVPPAPLGISDADEPAGVTDVTDDLSTGIAVTGDDSAVTVPSDVAAGLAIDVADVTEAVEPVAASNAGSAPVPAPRHSSRIPKPVDRFVPG